MVLDRAPVTLRASLRYRSFVRETGSTLFEDALVTFERRDAGAELGVGYVYPIGRLVFGVELAQYTPIVTFSNDQVLRSKHSGRVIHVYPGDQRDDAERRLHGYAAWVF